jgi:1-piperideine-2-carboxylate/1-pyrroline-2-carboxylate reductase [NAD(P)H]
MQILDHQSTEQVLPWEGMAAALRKVLQSQALGHTNCPVRSSVPLAGLPAGVMLTMPAADQHLAVVKTVTVHLGNPSHQPAFPAVQALLMVMDARTGERLALLDGEAVTVRRTAALSALAALAARAQGRELNGPLHIIGAGAQAKAHLQAFAALLESRECTIQSRTLQSAQALAGFAQGLGYRARVCVEPNQARPFGSANEAPEFVSIGDALEQASIIVTATSSATPVLYGPVKHDALICAVGAFTKTMAEVHASLVNQCTVVVDTMEGCIAEAGDLLQAYVDWSRITPLHALVCPAPCNEQEADQQPVVTPQPLLFKSVGSALWDLAAAHCWAQSRGL